MNRSARLCRGAPRGASPPARRGSPTPRGGCTAFGYTSSPPLRLRVANLVRRETMSRLPLGKFLPAVLLLLSAPLAAQTTARVEGTVSDASGSPIPGATVTAANTNTNATRTDVSDPHGAYTITAL